MSPAELLHEIHSEGVQLALTERGNIAIKGTSEQVEKWTPVIKQHKPELLKVLTAWADLETTIHACCDARQDSDLHRAALIADCWEEPPTDWPSLSGIFARMSCCR